MTTPGLQTRCWGCPPSSRRGALLASLLPPPAEAECGSSDDSTPATPNRERLDLVTSVFTCLGSWAPRSWVGAMSMTAGRALIRWEAAGAPTLSQPAELLGTPPALRAGGRRRHHRTRAPRRARP
ncbi:hypothetical protein B0H13DRAFT_2346729 [Mycena leptocephala]|nr:hypothetical protein B0H13DRAFT_2346729 [Mycena leptocephala]